eukprot:SAG31_NODE_3324_length_4411_cov_1.686456_5_plen_82_part_00
MDILQSDSYPYEMLNTILKLTLFSTANVLVSLHGHFYLNAQSHPRRWPLSREQHHIYDYGEGNDHHVLRYGIENDHGLRSQ